MTAFLPSLLGTLALLAAVVWTGVARRRRVHVTLVALAFASLTVTILLAERLGRGYDLDSAGTITPVHLALAKVATLAFLGPVATGIATWRNLAWRRWHLRAVVLALALAVAAVVTGTWMVLASEELPG